MDSVTGRLFVPALADLAHRSQELSRPEIGEETVRARLIDPLLAHLGYDADEDYEVWRGGDDAARFKVRVPPVERGSRRRSSFNPDYVPTVRKKIFWVMDAKKWTPEQKDEHIVQVLQYAIHPEIQARYGVIVNGEMISVYDAKTFFYDFGSDPYSPVFEMLIADLTARFAELRAILGSEQVRTHLIKCLVDDYEKLCTASLDEHLPHEILGALSAKAPGLSQTIEKNRAKVFVEYRDKEAAEAHKWLSDATEDELVAACAFPEGPLPLSPGCELSERVIHGQASFREVNHRLAKVPSSLYTQHQHLLFLALYLGRVVDSELTITEMTRLIRGPLELINECEAAYIRVIRKERILRANERARHVVAERNKTSTERERAAGVFSVESMLGPLESVAMAGVFPRLVRLTAEQITQALKQAAEYEGVIEADYRTIERKLPSDERLLDSVDQYGLWEPQLRRAIITNALNFRQESGRTAKSLLPPSIVDWLDAPAVPPLEWWKPANE